MPESRRLRAVAVASLMALIVALASVDYTVQRGDTLRKIARDHDVSVSELVDANGISNPDLIRVGQVLVIPGEEDEPDQVHIVASGETLNRIAARYGSTAAAIAGANNLANINLIYPGQSLLVPGGTSSPGQGSTGDEADSESDDDSSGSVDTVYVVRRGDTLQSIARQYQGASSFDIAQANSLANPNLIYPGQQLTIPGGSEPQESESSSSSGSSSTTRSGRYHVVTRGESVQSIAARYDGVTAEDIIRANGLVNGTIYSGTRLFLDGPGHVAQGTAGTGTYTVRSGDRLADIADRFDTSISRLAELNQIPNINLIRSGQVLEVPGGSSWVCPVDGPSFFNDWGFPRSGSRFHEGNDLFASFRAPVRAPVSGTVEFIVGSIGGNQFNLRGSDGVVYLGSHLDGFEGTSREVSAGEVLGYVGNTGNAFGTRPHLHFGMYYQSMPINPYPTLLANGCK